MKIIDDPYIGKKLKNTYDAEKLLSDLRRDVTDENYYVIALSSNEKNQLDIIHTLFLKSKWQRRMLPLVVGIASDKHEAYLIVNAIMNETMESRGDCNMRAYLSGKAGK